MIRKFISVVLVLVMTLMLGVSVYAEDRTIFGKDDRVKVSNTKKSPYSAVCNLTLNWSDGSLTYGTGFLIAPTKVATEAHCMYNKSKNIRVSSITIAPGDMVGSHPYGTKTVSGASNFVYPKKYQTEKDGIPYDYGVIKLNSAFYSSTNGSPATLPLKAMTNMENKEATIIGFHKNSANMWECSGTIKE